MKKINKRFRTSNGPENFRSFITAKSSKKKSKLDSRSVNKNLRSSTIKSFKAISRRKSLHFSKALPLIENSKRKRNKRSRLPAKKKKEQVKRSISKNAIKSRNMYANKLKKINIKANLSKKKSKKINLE